MRLGGGVLVTAGLVTAAALSLSGCAPGPSTPTIELGLQPMDASAVLQELDGGSWTSGGMIAFDELAALLPGIAPLRDGFAAQAAADDAAAATTYGLGPLKVGDDLLTALPKPSSLRSGTAGPSAAGTAGVALAGALTRSRALPGLAGGDAFDDYMAGAFGGDAVAGAQDAWRDASETGHADDPRPPGAPDEEHLGGDAEGNGHTQIDQHQDGSANGVSATSDTSIRYEGKVCPAADGKFDVTATIRRSASGTAGGSASWSQDIKAQLTGTLGDDAMPADMDMTATQSTSETGADGTEQHITTKHAMSWGDYVNGQGWDERRNPTQDLGRSDGISPEDATRMAQDGQGRADSLLVGLVISLARKWTDGTCVKIDADLAAQVQPKSSNDFTIRVTSKPFGNEVQGPLHLTLDGPDKLDPLESVSTGGFHYTAGDTGTSASVTIVATSKQGGAKLTKTVTTGKPHFFLLAAQFDQYSGTGWLCLTDSGETYGGAGAIYGGVVPDASGDASFVFTNKGEAGAGGLLGSIAVAVTGTYTLSYDGNGLPVGISGAVSGSRQTIGSGASAEKLSGPITGTLTLPDPANPEMDAACASGSVAKPG